MKLLGTIGQRFVAGLAALLLLVFSIGILFQRITITFNNQESSTIHNNSLIYIGALLVGVGVIWGLRFLLKKISSWQLFALGALFYLIAAAYLVYFGRTPIRADAGTVFSIAQGLLSNDFLIHLDYLDMYPFQLGLALYESALLAIHNSPTILFTMNALMTLGIDFLLWQMMQKQFGEGVAVKVTVLLSFLFLPQFFFILFAYGLIPGLFFMTLSLYCFTRYFATRRWYFMIFNVLFILLAGVLKNNYFIAGLAMVIVYLFDLLQHKCWVNVIAMLAILLAFALPQKVLNHYYDEQTGIELRGMPKTLHIAMGLQDKPNVSRPGGWYNGYNAETYQQYKDQPEGIKTMDALAKADIKDHVADYLTHPKRALHFFVTKFKTTWFNPTFQSIWSGPIEAPKQQVKTALLKNIYTGGKAFQWIYRFSHLILLTIVSGGVILVGYRLWHGSSFSALEWFGMLYLLGGTMFHLIWETKAQYVYPYVLMLIPLAASAIGGALRLRKNAGRYKEE